MNIQSKGEKVTSSQQFLTRDWDGVDKEHAQSRKIKADCRTEIGQYETVSFARDN